jgi:hypothetical protein
MPHFVLGMNRQTSNLNRWKAIMQTDYTKKKASNKIKTCPKCGRKGSYSHDVVDGKHGRVIFETYIHKSHPELGGIMRVIDDHCTIVTPSNIACTGQEPAGASENQVACGSCQ